MSWYLYVLIYAVAILWVADSFLIRSRSMSMRRRTFRPEVEAAMMWSPTTPGYEAAVERALSLVEHVNEYQLPAEGSVLTAYLKLEGSNHYYALQRITPRDMPTDALYGMPCVYAVFDNHIRLYPTPDRPYCVSYAQLQGGQPLTLEHLVALGGTISARERESRQRSIALLRDWLTPSQLAQFNEFHNFYVFGSDSRKLYLIHYAGGPYNVTDGVLDYCFIPAQSSGAKSPGDIMLAQKIALETNEERTLRLANKRRRTTLIPNFGNNHEAHSNEDCNETDWSTRDTMRRFSDCITDMGSQF